MITHPIGDLLDTAPCGFVSFTDDGVIEGANHTLEAMLGSAPGLLQDVKLESILTLPSRLFYQTHFFPMLKMHGKAEEISLSLLARDGKEIPVICNAVRRNRNGAVVNECVLVSVPQRHKYEREILEARRTAEEAVHSNEELIRTKQELEQHAQELDRQIRRLEQKNREMMRVTDILYHHLREPIRKIGLFINTLQEDNRAALTASGHLAADKIRAACGRMAVLLKTLQEFVSVDGADPAPEPVDLNAIVDRARRRAAAAAGVDPVGFESDALPVVRGYPRQLELLFYHLIENAIKFRRPDVPPVVKVSGTVIQRNSFRAIQGRYRYIDFVRVTVEDNGMGFDPSYREHIFDMLTKLDAGRSGPGSGLAICKKVAENHDGSISAESREGLGSAFTVFLPVER